MSVKSMIACAALGAAFLLSLSPVVIAQDTQTTSSRTVNQENIGHLIAQLRADASAHGVDIKNIQIHRSSIMKTKKDDTDGRMKPMLEKLCTVSAEVTIAEPGVTVSATASTCGQAAAMIEDLFGK